MVGNVVESVYPVMKMLPFPSSAIALPWSSLFPPMKVENTNVLVVGLILETNAL